MCLIVPWSCKVYSRCEDVPIILGVDGLTPVLIWSLHRLIDVIHQADRNKELRNWYRNSGHAIWGLFWVFSRNYMAAEGIVHRLHEDTAADHMFHRLHENMAADHMWVSQIAWGYGSWPQVWQLRIRNAWGKRNLSSPFWSLISMSALLYLEYNILISKCVFKVSFRKIWIGEQFENGLFDIHVCPLWVCIWAFTWRNEALGWLSMMLETCHYYCMISEEVSPMLVARLSSRQTRNPLEMSAWSRSTLAHCPETSSPTWHDNIMDRQQWWLLCPAPCRSSEQGFLVLPLEISQKTRESRLRRRWS